VGAKYFITINEKSSIIFIIFSLTMDNFFPTKNLSLFFLYFSLNVDNCISKTQTYLYFLVSSMSVNYIFPQNKKILILHICLHLEGMVFFHKQKFIELLDVILIKYPSFPQQKINLIKNVMATSCWCLFYS
jgi:hypothetical protein